MLLNLVFVLMFVSFTLMCIYGELFGVFDGQLSFGTTGLVRILNMLGGPPDLSAQQYEQSAYGWLALYYVCLLIMFMMLASFIIAVLSDAFSQVQKDLRHQVQVPSGYVMTAEHNAKLTYGDKISYMLYWRLWGYFVPTIRRKLSIASNAKMLGLALATPEAELRAQKSQVMGHLLGFEEGGIKLKQMKSAVNGTMNGAMKYLAPELLQGTAPSWADVTMEHLFSRGELNEMFGSSTLTAEMVRLFGAKRLEAEEEDEDFGEQEKDGARFVRTAPTQHGGQPSVQVLEKMLDDFKRGQIRALNIFVEDLKSGLRQIQPIKPSEDQMSDAPSGLNHDNGRVQGWPNLTSSVIENRVNEKHITLPRSELADLGLSSPLSNDTMANPRFRRSYVDL